MSKHKSTSLKVYCRNCEHSDSREILCNCNILHQPHTKCSECGDLWDYKLIDWED